MIFVVIPLLVPPLLMQVPDATWVAVLTLLILQTSFLVPPFGYSVMMVRNRTTRPLATAGLTRALLPFLLAQLVVLGLVLAFPQWLWRDASVTAAPEKNVPATSDVDLNDLLGKQLDQNQAAEDKKTKP
jgi:TRAP-type mannitol/chloroaromatic compound transport system permease large subunit